MVSCDEVLFSFEKSSILCMRVTSSHLRRVFLDVLTCLFLSCLRALQEGDYDGFYGKLKDTKKVMHDFS